MTIGVEGLLKKDEENIKEQRVRNGRMYFSKVCNTASQLQDKWTGKDKMKQKRQRRDWSSADRILAVTTSHDKAKDGRNLNFAVTIFFLAM